MITVCTNCKKKFDNEKYYGICPKCGAFHYHRSEADHAEFHRLYDYGYQHNEYDDHQRFHDNYDNDSEASHKQNASVNQYTSNKTSSQKQNPEKKPKNFSCLFFIIFFLVWIFSIMSTLGVDFRDIFEELFSF